MLKNDKCYSLLQKEKEEEKEKRSLWIYNKVLRSRFLLLIAMPVRGVEKEREI